MVSYVVSYYRVLRHGSVNPGRESMSSEGFEVEARSARSRPFQQLSSREEWEGVMEGSSEFSSAHSCRLRLAPRNAG